MFLSIGDSSDSGEDEIELSDKDDIGEDEVEPNGMGNTGGDDKEFYKHANGETACSKQGTCSSVDNDPKGLKSHNLTGEHLVLGDCSNQPVVYKIVTGIKAPPIVKRRGRSRHDYHWTSSKEIQKGRF